MRHTCHAVNCTVEVPRKMFMCLRHWRLVPKDMQRKIWKHYQPGQENDMDLVTDAYLDAARAARQAVAAKEAQP